MGKYKHFNPEEHRIDVQMAKVRASSHSKHNINYHIVFIPKYRKAVLVGDKLKEILSTIIRGQCEDMQCELLALEIMPDPPYGTKINKMNFVKSGAVKVGGAYRNDYRDHPTNWDEEGLTEQYFKEIQRISKNQVIFGANNFSSILPNSRCWVVWDKRGEEKYNNDFADCELIWTSFDKPARVIRFLWSGMLQGDMKNKEKRLHPTQKPIFVMRKLIEMFTKERDKIIDCFMGTGSTLVACKQLKRDFVGIELHEKYFKIAQERLQQNTLNKSEEVKQEAMQSEARHSSQA